MKKYIMPQMTIQKIQLSEQINKMSNGDKVNNSVGGTQLTKERDEDNESTTWSDDGLW